MKSLVLSALSLVLTIGLFSGCSGSDTTPIVSNAPPAVAAGDDQRVPQSDALTSAESSLVNQANAEPAPAQKSDL